jgi:hypothetical protein
MPRRTLLLLCVVLIGMSDAGGRERNTPVKRIPQIHINRVSDAMTGVFAGPHSAPLNTANDTTVLGYWTFDTPGCNAQGWTTVDRTTQTGVYFHVDDFAGLGGGDFGRLQPLEGSQSMWCGAREAPQVPLSCGYATLPGYGNEWDQWLMTVSCLDVAGDVVIDYKAAWDSEITFDPTIIEMNDCDHLYWTVVSYGGGRHEGVGSGVMSFVVPESRHDGELRIRFRFTSDTAWSDEDGMYDTDGAFIIDSLTVSDTTGVILPTELFEVESVGDTITASGNWVARAMPGYGDFAGLFPGAQVVQEDVCGYTPSCLWGFFEGSTWDYGCEGWPDQKVVPYGNIRGQYIENDIWSPLIPLAGSGAGVELEFRVYRGMTNDSSVRYVWYVRSIIGGCAGDWRSEGYVYGGESKEWHLDTLPLGHLIESGATHIQVALGVFDVCYFVAPWCGGCHSHAPLFDDVRVYRVDTVGPQWSVRDVDMFQDNFSADGTVTGTARADAALDILPSNSAGILPGDSVCVTAADPENGLDFHVTGDPSSGPAVYCYVSVDGPHAAVTGASLIDGARYDAVGTQMIGGRTWTQVQMDSCFTAAGAVVADRYNIDLHDDLFIPGDTVWFFFGARSAPPSGLWSYYSLAAPATGTSDIAEAAANPDEFTILPAAGLHVAGNILYVDGMNFRGAQPFFDSAFQALDCGQYVDRYDIRGPSSAVGNHPGSRVVDVFQQLIPIYQIITWNTGDLSTAFGDGRGYPTDKSDDTGLLYTFLDQTMQTSMVYLNGDNVADMWQNEMNDASAIQLRNTYMNFSVVSGDHVPFVGISPLVVGEPGGIFDEISGPDTLVAYGGCPVVNDFDVLQPTGISTLEMSYHGGGATAGAVLRQATTNAQGSTVGMVLSGFSFHNIRDARPGGVPARAEHLKKVWRSFGVGPNNPPTDARPTELAVNSLAQNHPNPFNPVTTIDYSIARRGHVSLKVYNVAGQLVSTLVDEVQTPENMTSVTWNGANDAGQEVSSGVYFYKIVTKGFTQTRKMVILK